MSPNVATINFANLLPAPWGALAEEFLSKLSPRDQQQWLGAGLIGLGLYLVFQAKG